MFLIYCDHQHGRSYWGKEGFGARHFATIYPDLPTAEEGSCDVMSFFFKKREEGTLQYMVCYGEVIIEDVKTNHDT